MKKIHFLYFMFLLVAALPSCRPEDLKEFVPAQSAGDVKAISGVWKGSQVIQHDLDAVRNDYPFKSLDITQPMQFNTVTLTLNADNGAPTTFSINYGVGAPLLKFTSGNWRVDNTSKIGQIQLINGTDTVRYKLGNYNMIAGGKMLLNTTKKLGTKEVIAYDFFFSK